MIEGRDSSSSRPTPDQARAAYVAGVRAWGGYLVSDDDSIVLANRANRTPAMHNLAAPWTRADFEVVRAAGMRPLAFSSGWDDPAALRAKASAWGLLALLDHEAEIRPDGPWAGDWLQVSGFGLYGLDAVQARWGAPYRIVALYPAGGCTGATWPTGWVPSVPHGWQCQGTHTEFGLEVDRLQLDDWFGGRRMTLEEKQEKVLDWYTMYAGRANPSSMEIDGWVQQMADDGSNLRDLRDQFQFAPECQSFLAQVARLKAGTLGGPAGPATDQALRDYLRGTPAS